VVDIEVNKMERAKGFEPSTSTLARLRSTRLSYARFQCIQQVAKLSEGFPNASLDLMAEKAAPAGVSSQSVAGSKGFDIVLA
jgi:hypothetical protein